MPEHDQEPLVKVKGGCRGRVIAVIVVLAAVVIILAVFLVRAMFMQQPTIPPPVR